VQLSERDRTLLAWCAEQYTVRVDLLAVLMAQHSADPEARARGRVTHQVVSRRLLAWKHAGLVKSRTFLAATPATVWLTAEGVAVCGSPWRPYEPTLATVAHRHAVGLVRAEAEAMGRGWICERELREGLGGRPLYPSETGGFAGGPKSHLPDGVVLSTDDRGKQWHTAVEVELTRKTEARVSAILRQLLATYDDVVYRAAPGAATVVKRAVAGLDRGAERIFVKPYPPPALAAVA
jgi:hypothetical protein